MMDVRDGEPVEIAGLPEGVQAFRHSDGVYLWEMTPRGGHHVHLGENYGPSDLGARLNNMGHGDCQLARDGFAAWQRSRGKK